MKPRLVCDEIGWGLLLRRVRSRERGKLESVPRKKQSKDPSLQNWERKVADLQMNEEPESTAAKRRYEVKERLKDARGRILIRGPNM